MRTCISYDILLSGDVCRLVHCIPFLHLSSYNKYARKRKYVFLILLGGIAYIHAWGCCCHRIHLRLCLVYKHFMKKMFGTSGMVNIM